MTYDQAQTSRLGQKLAPENPGVRIVDLAGLPEVAYRGQIVYLSDVDYIMIYDGNAWNAVGDTSANVLYLGSDDPADDPDIILNPGDQWLDQTTNVLLVWDGTVWVTPELADDSVDTDQLAAFALTGKHTLIGSTYMTNNSGNRMQIRDDASAGVLEGFTGHADEVAPGVFNPGYEPGGVKVRGLLQITSPDMGYGAASIKIGSSTGPGSTPTVKVDGAELIVDLEGMICSGPATFTDEIHNSGIVPIGAVTMFMGFSAPAGWLICDGSTFSSITYPDLYDLLGFSTTLPDLRDRVPVGAGSQVSFGGNEGRSVGSRDPVTHAHAMSHDHDITNEPGHDHVISSAVGTSMDEGNGTFGSRLVIGTHAHGGSTGTAGGHDHGGVTDDTNTANTSVAPTQAHYGLNFIIRGR